MMMVGEVIGDFLKQLSEFVPERYPVRNREPRIQLDGRLWHLIHERDGGVCWVCQRPVVKGEGEIDHLIPRSSFPPDQVESVADRSWNLRLACVDCNQAKSNFSVFALPRTFGVTLRCWDCTEHDEFQEPVELSVIAHCGSCSFTSRVPDEGWLL